MEVIQEIGPSDDHKELLKEKSGVSVEESGPPMKESDSLNEESSPPTSGSGPAMAESGTPEEESGPAMAVSATHEEDSGPSIEQPGPPMEKSGLSTGSPENDMSMDYSTLENSFTEENFNRFQELIMSSTVVDSNDEEIEESSCNKDKDTKIAEKEKSSQLNKQNNESNVDSSDESSKRVKKKKRIRFKSPECEREASSSKRKKKDFQPPKLKEPNRDIFCWKCHKYGDVVPCSVCPRVYHLRCSLLPEKPSQEWICTECDDISRAEKLARTSPVLKKILPNDLYCLLLFVIKRMRQHEGSKHFEYPVDPVQYPDYQDYIVRPMCLTELEDNVTSIKYTNCQAFLADVKWMVHNSYIFNTVYSELTSYAKTMFRKANHDCEEIINCPYCYLHANTLDDDEWFIEPCDRPHILVWARLHGYPFWPCKVMSFRGNKNADVRFFGDHNKSLVPVEQCYLYSKQTPSKQKKCPELKAAIEESYEHIKKLELMFGEFCFAPARVLLNPKEESEQRRLLLPHFLEDDPLALDNDTQKLVTKKEDCRVTITVPRPVQSPMTWHQNSKNGNNIPQNRHLPIVHCKGNTSLKRISYSTQSLGILNNSAYGNSTRSTISTILIEDDDYDNGAQSMSFDVEVLEKSGYRSSVPEKNMPQMSLNNSSCKSSTKTDEIISKSKGHFLSQFNLAKKSHSAVAEMDNSRIISNFKKSSEILSDKLLLDVGINALNYLPESQKKGNLNKNGDEGSDRNGLEINSAGVEPAPKQLLSPTDSHSSKEVNSATKLKKRRLIHKRKRESPKIYKTKLEVVKYLSLMKKDNRSKSISFLEKIDPELLIPDVMVQKLDIERDKLNPDESRNLEPKSNDITMEHAVEESSLNFNDLNGNIDNFVKVTKIDLIPETSDNDDKELPKSNSSLIKIKMENYLDTNSDGEHLDRETSIDNEYFQEQVSKYCEAYLKYSNETSPESDYNEKCVESCGTPNEVPESNLDLNGESLKREKVFFSSICSSGNIQKALDELWGTCSNSNRNLIINKLPMKEKSVVTSHIDGSQYKKCSMESSSDSNLIASPLSKGYNNCEGNNKKITDKPIVLIDDVLGTQKPLVVESSIDEPMMLDNTNLHAKKSQNVENTIDEPITLNNNLLEQKQLNIKNSIESASVVIECDSDDSSSRHSSSSLSNSDPEYVSDESQVHEINDHIGVQQTNTKIVVSDFSNIFRNSNKKQAQEQQKFDGSSNNKNISLINNMLSLPEATNLRYDSSTLKLSTRGLHPLNSVLVSDMSQSSIYNKTVLENNRNLSVEGTSSTFKKTSETNLDVTKPASLWSTDSVYGLKMGRGKRPKLLEGVSFVPTPKYPAECYNYILGDKELAYKNVPSPFHIFQLYKDCKHFPKTIASHIEFITGPNKSLESWNVLPVFDAKSEKSDDQSNFCFDCRSFCIEEDGEEGEYSNDLYIDEDASQDSDNKSCSSDESDKMIVKSPANDVSIQNENSSNNTVICKDKSGDKDNPDLASATIKKEEDVSTSKLTTTLNKFMGEVDITKNDTESEVSQLANDSDSKEKRKSQEIDCMEDENTFEKESKKKVKYKMLTPELEECVSAIEEFVPKSKQHFFWKKLKEFEEITRRKLEIFKREYIEEMDSLYMAEKELLLQNSKDSSEDYHLIEDIKRKQWCVLCLNEAKFHCCWSTSYCSEKCQLADWPVHSKDCTQYQMRPGDPDLRLSPVFRSLVTKANARHLTMKDLADHIEDTRQGPRTISQPNRTQMPGISGSGSSDTNTSSKDSDVSSRTIITSASSSSLIKALQQGKGVYHIQKEGSSKTHQTVVKILGRTSTDTDNSNRPLLVTIPVSHNNKGSTLVSVGQTIPPRSLSKYTIAGQKPQMVLMGKNKLILPKHLRAPGKVFSAAMSKTYFENKTSNEESQIFIDPSSQNNTRLTTQPISSPSATLGSKKINISKPRTVIVLENSDGGPLQINIPEHLISSNKPGSSSPFIPTPSTSKDNT